VSTRGGQRATERSIRDLQRNGRPAGVENSFDGTTRDPNLISRGGDSNLPPESGDGMFVYICLKPVAHEAYQRDEADIKGRIPGPVNTRLPHRAAGKESGSCLDFFPLWCGILFREPLL